MASTQLCGQGLRVAQAGAGSLVGIHAFVREPFGISSSPDSTPKLLIELLNVSDLLSKPPPDLFPKSP